MKKFTMIIITVLMLFTACTTKTESTEKEKSNGVTEYKNSDTPGDPNAKLELKKLFTITTEAQTDTSAYFRRPISLSVDKMNNIYVLDIMSMSVKKFDNEGNFVKSIGRSGQGPGELFWPSIMMIDKDTLKVVSAGSNKLSKFDLDGNFYSEKLIDRVQIQNPKISRDGSKFVAYMVKPIMKEGQQPDLDFSLSVIDPDSLKQTHSLNNRILAMADMMAGKFDLNDLAIPFCPGDDYIYVSENSDSQFKIFGYGYDGEKKFEIRKKYQRIRYEAEEKEEYLENLKRVSQGGMQNLKVGNFKKAITNMHTDKYGRLLVLPNVDRNSDPDGVYIDIFKDGKFLNRVDYPVQDKENSGVLSLFRTSEYFIKDRLYVINMEELSLDVYDY